MLEVFQKTLSKQVTFKGIGLHSGKNSVMKVLPGKENLGIVFKRVDLESNNLIKASFDNVCMARLCTTLKNKNNIKVSTVEHVLAALYIAGIDNAIIEIDNEEVPIMDGSAKDFLNELKKVKLVRQQSERKYLYVKEKIELIDGKREISIEPSDTSFEVDFQLDYKNKIIGDQRNIVNFETDNIDDVINSRTFCLYEDIEKIKKVGLAKGGSLNNAIVVKENQVLNEGGLRTKKEFVTHKILDLAGDFVLSGHRVIGKVKCYQGGHELTNLFLRKIFSYKSSFSLKELGKIKIPQSNKLKQSLKLAANA